MHRALLQARTEPGVTFQASNAAAATIGTPPHVEREQVRRRILRSAGDLQRRIGHQRAGHRRCGCELDPEEAEALRAAMEGEPLEGVCASFADRPDPAAEAHAAISSWFAEGWIAGVASAAP